MNRLNSVRLAWTLAALVPLSAVSADDATDKGAAEAEAVLAKAIKTPPTGKDEIQLARKAFRTLLKQKRPGLAKTALTIGSDTRQADRVRGDAILVLGDLPDSPAERVRALVLPILKGTDGSTSIRAMAASSLSKDRIADDASRAILEEVLLRGEENRIVQRTCLRTLAKTAKLSKIRSLLLRPELYENPYYGIRVDVCSGLASLGVRSRKALEILCTLMTEDDYNDSRFLVPQEAWLSFWTLTGRHHGITDSRGFAKTPGTYSDEKLVRTNLWNISFTRIGVDVKMVTKVQQLTCANFAAAAVRQHGSKVPWVRNTKGLDAAAKAFRADFDAIVKEWESAKKR